MFTGNAGELEITIRIGDRATRPRSYLARGFFKYGGKRSRPVATPGEHEGSESVAVAAGRLCGDCSSNGDS